MAPGLGGAWRRRKTKYLGRAIILWGVPAKQAAAARRALTEGFGAALRPTLDQLSGQVAGALMIGQIDQRDQVLRVIECSGRMGYEVAPGAETPLGGPFCERLALARLPTLWHAAAGDEGVPLPASGSRILTANSLAAVALVPARTDTLGVVCAFDERSRPYGERDLDRLELAAHVLSSRLEEDQRDRITDLLGDELRRHALFDHLTGVGNRARFVAQVEREWVLTHKRWSHSSCLTIATIQGARSLTFQLGREVTDEIVRRLAAALTAASRASDAIGRIDDGSFGVLLGGCKNDRQASVFERRMRAELARSRGDGPEFDLTVVNTPLRKVRSAADARGLVGGY